MSAITWNGNDTRWFFRMVMREKMDMYFKKISEDRDA